ncbi:MAG: hypothetical protein WAW45_04595, partial [Atribacterota bacterium]
MHNLFRILVPDVYLENIYSIDMAKLKEKKNIKGIILDLDNTIIPWGTNNLDDRVLEWVEQVKQNGIRLCLVSNTHKKISDIGHKL